MSVTAHRAMCNQTLRNNIIRDLSEGEIYKVQWNIRNYFYSIIILCLQCFLLYRARRRFVVSLTLILIQCCASLCTIWLSEHCFHFVYEHSMHIFWSGPLAWNISVSECRGTATKEGWYTMVTPRLWIVSDPQHRSENWKNSKASNLGMMVLKIPEEVMHCSWRPPYHSTCRRETLCNSLVWHIA